MINQFRADFYRQTHTIGIYILSFLVVLYSTLTVKNEMVGGIMMNGTTQDSFNGVFHGSWTQLLAVRALSIGSSILLYVFIGIFVIIFGYEFTQKTYKNSLTSGISRTGFFIGKYLTMLIDIIFLELLYFFSGILVSYLIGNQPGTTIKNLIGLTFATSIVMSFFISIIFSLAVCCLLITNSIVISSLFIVIFSILVSIVHSLLNWDWLKYLDFFGATNQFTLKQISSNALIPYISFGFILLIICCIISNLVLKNKEL